MGNTFYSLPGRFFVFGILLFLLGCAGEPVPIDWPANHPANPDSEQSAYRPAINPFQDTVSMHGMKSSQGSSMSHGGPMDSHTPQKKPEHNSHGTSKEIKTEQSDHNH